ncbi:MAG: DAK2 domain-containing protein [Coprobacillus sp.]|nr:DAK2 domain-containing protein [Coprobacillus sp.]MDY4145805.1 DAK2 domain-containing protein [Bacilli bacterium]
MNIIGKMDLDGKTFKQMLVYGAASLRKNIEIVNNLNVFPVPDGDTGTNMKMTFDSGLSALTWDKDEGIGSVSEKFAQGMLLGARGNSGVILSQIFKGISNGLIGKETVNAMELGQAFSEGVKQSYMAVRKPVEGTILTVFREATEKANDNTNIKTSIDDYFNTFLNEGEKSLKKTPELLPILKEAGVIDSGGAGLIYIIKGMIGDSTDENITYSNEVEEKKPTQIKRIVFNEKGELDYAYCTEFLLQLQPKKVNIETFDIQEIISKLEEMNGDSIVTIKDGDIVKVHVHTKHPGAVFELAQEYGEFISVKVENMAIQHNETTIENNYKVSKHKDVAIITVAKDAGFANLFKEMGADYIVDGGQSMNPSSNDFLKAFDSVNADNIIVLPNNSNIILACNQAKELYKKSNVYIVPTKTLGEGYSALALYDPSETLENAISTFESQEECVTTIEITKSVREAALNGIDIHKDDYIAISGKAMLSSSKDYFETIKESLSKTLDNRERSIITVFMGIDTKEEDEEKIANFINENYQNIEVYFLYTNQDIYNFIIVLE